MRNKAQKVQPSRQRIALILALVITLMPGLCGCAGRGKTSSLVEAEVQRVASGHSLEVTLPQVDPARIQRVRLIGIDAPNPAQEPWGLASQQFLREQLDRAKTEADGSGKARIQL